MGVWRQVFLNSRPAWKRQRSTTGTPHGATGRHSDSSYSPAHKGQKNKMASRQNLDRLLPSLPRTTSVPEHLARQVTSDSDPVCRRLAVAYTVLPHDACGSSIAREPRSTAPHVLTGVFVQLLPSPHLRPDCLVASVSHVTHEAAIGQRSVGFFLRRPVLTGVGSLHLHVRLWNRVRINAVFKHTNQLRHVELTSFNRMAQADAMMTGMQNRSAKETCACSRPAIVFSAGQSPMTASTGSNGGSEGQSYVALDMLVMKLPLLPLL